MRISTTREAHQHLKGGGGEGRESAQPTNKATNIITISERASEATTLLNCCTRNNNNNNNSIRLLLLLRVDQSHLMEGERGGMTVSV